MTTFTLYRGIAVPTSDGEEVIHRIRQEGLLGTEGVWQPVFPDLERLRSNLDALFHQPALAMESLGSRDTGLAFCCSGTKQGAEYYATLHNRSGADNFPLVIEFSARIDQLRVDGRDFLFTAFQQWDFQGQDNAICQKDVLMDLFGGAIGRYFDSATHTSIVERRIAMCHLAIADPDVVSGHYANRKVIGGRYGTQFASAFIVNAPIEAKDIAQIYLPETVALKPADITLQAFIDLGRSNR